MYTHPSWQEFRQHVIELDRGTCCKCGRLEPEVILQVHHKQYIPGKLPWEYAFQDCETVCKGCHAMIHGRILPSFGWEFCDHEDLGDLIGLCEYCSTTIRHLYVIFHPEWGVMNVGTDCCDNLTDSKIASNLKDSITRFEKRKNTFLTSSRWNYENNVYSIRQNVFEIIITEQEEKFFIQIHRYKSKHHYQSINEAKEKVFDVLESGSLLDWMKKKNHSLPQTKARKPKKT